MDISSRRTTTLTYADALAARALPQRVSPGASSYFTAPEGALDPNLFRPSEKMKSHVRAWLQTTLHQFLTSKGFHDVGHWSRIWVAGSGASYQWAAARDPGDLDILIGVDYQRFREANLRYVGLSNTEISDQLNEIMSSDLWKRTANQQIGQSTYEVTWYVNPGATDIRSINPYAAYDVDRSEWTVRPIDLPAAGPGEWFPQEYANQAHADQLTAVNVVQRYNSARSALQAASNVGQYTNATAALVQATREAETLFDTIHLGRHGAFDANGQGYRDFANYRWQRGKQLGTIPALRAIHDEAKSAREEAEVSLYGKKLANTEQVRVTAALGALR